MAIKICIDAGHYGKYNRSPAVKEYYESDMNWKLHLLQKKYLEEYGIEVITTRPSKDKDLALKARGKAAEGSDLLLSDHSNAVGSSVNESVDYPLVYVPIDGSGTELGKKLAKCIESVMGTKQAGQCKSKKGSGNWDYHGVIYGATSVGVTGLILEHSFHTNTKMTKWLMDESNLDKLARAEADVIAAHYGIEKPQAEPEHLYRIRERWDNAQSQVGAYKSLENAKAACLEGYTVYDWNGQAVHTNIPKPTTYTVELETLQRGVKGNTVKLMQLLLIGNGYDMVGYGADGSFGGVTERALKAYQTAVGLNADGICGPQTWKKLLGVKT